MKWPAKCIVGREGSCNLQRVCWALFDPAEFGAPPPKWSIARDWSARAGAGAQMNLKGATQTGNEPGHTKASPRVNN
jgi:hypothetical protein